MLLPLLKLKLKQVIGSFRASSLLKFFAPDLLAGAFMALSNGNRADLNFSNPVDPSFATRVGVVACGISLFTLIVETRKLFFTAGDVESFYFVQPTKISRFVSFSTVALLSFMVTSSVAAPALFFISPDAGFFSKTISAFLLAFCSSTLFYLLIVSFISLLPRRIADSSLTIFQILIALTLLAAFQLPSLAENLFGLNGSQAIPVLLSRQNYLPIAGLLVSFFLFLIFPVQEKLVSKLGEHGSDSSTDLLSLIARFRKALFLKGEEENAGFIFFASNIFRNRSFRLSAIGMAATPAIVAIYWTLRGFHFIILNVSGALPNSELAAPMASLVASGVMVHYFLSKSLLGSKDYDARWLFDANPPFSSGRFVKGVRKGFLVTVHIPMSIAVFIVIVRQGSLLESALTGLTFLLLTHVAVSFFSIMQRNLPFTMPFTQNDSSGMTDLIFMIAYSVLIIFLLLLSYCRIEYLLMLNLFAFIFVGILEYFSVEIIDKRLKLGA